MRIFDSHTHCFPEKIAADCIGYLSEEAGITPSFDGTLDGLRKSMESAGITVSLNLPIATKPEQVVSINRWAAEHNSLPILSLGTVHPAVPSPAEKLADLKALGLKGIKLHPEYQDFCPDSPRMKEIWGACSKLGLVVVMHCGEDIGFSPPSKSSPKQIRKVLEAFPALHFVAAHFGSWQMWQQVEECLIGRRLFLDLSFTLPYFSPEKIVSLIREHGVDRVLFATDAPWRNQQEALQRFLRLPLADSEKEAILWSNAVQLFDVDSDYGVDISELQDTDDSLGESGDGMLSCAERQRLLSLSDTQLAGECRMQCCRGSGPGGRKRNSSDSSVTATHTATGLSASASDIRSQAANRRIALRRLRRKIAFKCRCEPEPYRKQWCPAEKNPVFPLWTAAVLDAMQFHQGRVSESAHCFKISTGKFVRCIAKYPALWERVNRIRTAFDLPALRTP